jgi:hypothetical protein
MTEERAKCPSCGTRGSVLVEGRLCPACLLRLALRASSPDQDDVDPEERYHVRAVIDECEDATAYLAEHVASSRLVRLEVSKAAGETDASEVRKRAAAVEKLPGGAPRLIDAGTTNDGRVWVAADYAPRRTRNAWLLRLLLATEV